MRKINLTGRRFGRLVVLCEGNKKGKNTTWHCKCDCGKELDIIAYNLKMVTQGHVVVFALDVNSKTPQKAWRYKNKVV